jgi:hypothetical protein
MTRDPLPPGDTWWKRLADTIGDGLAWLLRIIGWLLRDLWRW